MNPNFYDVFVIPNGEVTEVISRKYGNNVPRKQHKGVIEGVLNQN